MINANLPICLIGDSNARTGLSDDFIDLDDHVAYLTGLVKSNDDFLYMKSILNSKGECTEIFNSDQETNKNGDNLVVEQMT